MLNRCCRCVGPTGWGKIVGGALGDREEEEGWGSARAAGWVHLSSLSAGVRNTGGCRLGARVYQPKKSYGEPKSELSLNPDLFLSLARGRNSSSFQAQAKLSLDIPPHF